MRLRRWHARAVLVALGLAGLAVAAGCGQNAAVAAPDTTGSTSSTTTTTTTLPRPVGLAFTTPNGADSFLGPVLRVRVAEPSLHTVVPPPTPSGPVLGPPKTRLAYRQFGSGPDLLLVMGQHGTLTWWDPSILNDLAARFRVTVFDLPGVGYSAAGPAPLGLDEAADETAGLALALGLVGKPLTVLGWGLGGDVAIDAVVRHPGLATGLVLLDTPAPGRLNTPTPRDARRALSSPRSTMVGLSRLMFPASADQARRQWLDRVGEVEPDNAVASSVTAEARMADALQGDTALANALSRLRLPVRVMTGALDEIVPPANATALHRAIPASHLLVLHGGGYAALVTNWPRVLGALVAFAT